MKAVLLLSFALFYIANCTSPPKYWCTCDKCPAGYSKVLIFLIFNSLICLICLIFSKGLGQGCDPRKSMDQCIDGLYCYQKSVGRGDGMCVPMCESGGYINYSKIGTHLKISNSKCFLTHGLLKSMSYQKQKNISGKSTSKRVKRLSFMYPSTSIKPAYWPNVCICPKCPEGTVTYYVLNLQCTVVFRVLIHWHRKKGNSIAKLSGANVDMKIVPKLQ